MRTANTASRLPARIFKQPNRRQRPMAQRRELGFGSCRRLHMEQPQLAKCLRSTMRGSVAVRSARYSARRREVFISAKFGAETSRPLAAPQPGRAQGSEATAIAAHSSNGPQDSQAYP